MRDIRKDIESGRTQIEETLAQIPGFQGYASREQRREADKVVRDHLVALLNQAKTKIELARSNLSARLALDDLDDIDRAARKLTTLTDRIRYADRGYTGFLDPIKIDDETLDRVYEADASLVTGIDSVIQSADLVSTASQDGDLQAALKAFTETLQTIEQHLEKREAILRGVA